MMYMMEQQTSKDEVLHETLGKNRSEEVVHLIEQMPTNFGWMVSIIVIVIVILIMGFGWGIKYPDVLKGQITINNRQAPVRLVSNTPGGIQLYAFNGEAVKKGEYLAVIRNSADTRNVQFLDSLLENIDIHHVDYAHHRHYFPENIVIGELNQYYFAFLTALYQYLDYYHEGSFEKQRDILLKQQVSLNSLLSSAKNNYKSEFQKYKLEEGFYSRDSILFKKHVIAAQEFEKEKQLLVNSRQQYQVLEKDITSDKFQIQDASNKIEQLIIQKADKEHDLQINVYNHFYELKEAIRTWEHKYVFVAPFSGKIAFLSFWKNDDYIESGREVFSVIPLQKSLIGQVQLPELGAGKVLTGQDVIIKLDNYPYTQFGSVKGKVVSMSAITNQQMTINNQKTSNYLVTVSLPNDLRTNYGAVLNFHYEAKGSAEIITDKRRLIERLFDNLRHSTR